MADTANQMAVPDPTRVLRQELAMWKNRARVWEGQFKALVDELAEERAEHQDTHTARYRAEQWASRSSERTCDLRVGLSDAVAVMRDLHLKAHPKHRNPAVPPGKRVPMVEAQRCATCIFIGRMKQLADPAHDLRRSDA